MLKKNKNYFVSVGIIAAIVFSFQNCGQNMTANNNTSSSSNVSPTGTSLAACIASGCPQSLQYIQVEISNNNPISYLVNGSTVVETSVDVSGYCNSGGYPGSHMYYSIQDLAGNIVVPNSPTIGVCNSLGKFHFPISISGLSATNNYQLIVILRGVDSTGAEYDNSLGLNKRSVGLSPRTGI